MKKSCTTIEIGGNLFEVDDTASINTGEKCLKETNVYISFV